jgi:hypothetical protein
MLEMAQQSIKIATVNFMQVLHPTWGIFADPIIPKNVPAYIYPILILCGGMNPSAEGLLTALENLLMRLSALLPMSFQKSWHVLMIPA